MGNNYEHLNNYAHLPPHIIVKILHVLNLNDFKNAVQTCKEWYKISCCSTIAHRYKINLKRNKNKLHKYLKRPFDRLQLTKVNLSQWNYKVFLNKFAYSIRELYVVRCTIKWNELVKCLKYLPNLESLLIELSCNTKIKFIEESCSQLSSTLEKLKKLNFTCHPEQIKILHYFICKCFNLKELTYSIVEVYTTEYRTDPLPDTYEIFNNIRYAIQQRPSVDFNSITIQSERRHDSCLSTERRINHITIKKLNSLNASDEYIWAEFYKVCKKFPHLITFEMQLVDGSVLVDPCESLLDLFFPNTPAFCFRGFQSYHHDFQSTPEFLNVVPHNDFLYQPIELTTLRMPNVTNLTLIHVRISREILNLLCVAFNNVTTLQLYLNTHDCSPIFKHQNKLQILEIYFWSTCPEPFEDISTEYSCVNLTELHSLKITKHVPGLTAELIKKLKSLKSYDFGESTVGFFDFRRYISS